MRNIVINFPLKRNLFSFLYTHARELSAAPISGLSRLTLEMASVLESNDTNSWYSLGFFHIKHLIDVRLASGLVQITQNSGRERMRITPANTFREIYLNISENLVSLGRVLFFWVESVGLWGVGDENWEENVANGHKILWKKNSKRKKNQQIFFVGIEP